MVGRSRASMPSSTLRAVRTPSMLYRMRLRVDATSGRMPTSIVSVAVSLAM
jgi:hypothetical protein